MDFSPCPATSRDPFFFIHDDGVEDTALVEYTTEFSAQQYGGKAPNRLSVAPKRRPFPVAKKAAAAADQPFVIHEDIPDLQETDEESLRVEDSYENIESAPVHKPLRSRASGKFNNEKPIKQAQAIEVSAPSSEGLNAAPKRGTRRISGLLAAHQEQVRVEKEKEKLTQRRSGKAEESNRTSSGNNRENALLPRTTRSTAGAIREKQAAAANGLKPSTRLAASKRASGENATSNVRKTSETATRTTRSLAEKKSTLRAPPKRPLPLQPSKSQLHSVAVDKHGALTGKENIAPGKKTVVEIEQPLRKRTASGEAKVQQVKPKPRSAVSTLKRSSDTKLTTRAKVSTSPKARKLSTDRLSGPKAKPAVSKKQPLNHLDIGLPSSNAATSHPKQVSIVKAAAALSSIHSKKRSLDAISVSTDDELADFSFGSTRSSASSSDFGGHESAKWGLRLVKRHKKSDASIKEDPNPILQEDIPRPEMYENSWLDAQESSLTMLLNEILDVGSVDKFSGASSRNKLLQRYSMEPFPLLYKRIQASLLYGALSIPKDILDKNMKLSEDLGLKRRFLDLFLKSYSLAPLACCLEVVIGRAVAGAGEYKNVEAFLERFFVRAEDDEGQWSAKGSKNGVKVWAEGEEMGEKAWMLRRTLLRSFMLILLLDIGKREGTIHGCLFLNSSPYKSTAEVVHAMARLLLPSLGDILRPLSHLNFLPAHKQAPLEEYSYRITNLAVDLRDGIRLARVLEVLTRQVTPNSLTGPISSQLKFPAQSRAVKVANLQVIVDFLNDHNANPGAVTASDIVDGARERSLGLLWVLVSKWGLSRILDWEDLRRHIGRLQKKLESRRVSISDDYPVWDEEEDHENYEEKLRLWARYVARVHGLEISNFTTSFADGKVFSAIVSEYEGYFPVNNQASPGAGLPEKLRALGCSRHFSSLFSTSKLASGRVFDENFVISALAFLCSRLMGWSIAARSATLIQNAYRRYISRREIRRRVRLAVLAKYAAQYVQARDRVTNAAIVIQRAFRAALQSRMERFFKAVIGMQACVRGCLVRTRIYGRSAHMIVDDDEEGDESRVNESTVVYEETGLFSGGVEEDEEEGDDTFLQARRTPRMQQPEHTASSIASVNFDDTVSDIWLAYGRGGL